MVDKEKIKKKVIDENKGLYDDGIWFYINSCTTWNSDEEKEEAQRDVKAVLHRTIEDTVRFTLEEIEG